MRVIKLKEMWNTKDSNLVINDRLTEFCLSAYQNAVDATFKHNESHREIYLVKQAVQQHNTAIKSGKNPSNFCDVQHISAGDPRRDMQNTSARNPMRDFFRRNKHEGCYMTAHEDRHSRFCDSNEGY